MTYRKLLLALISVSLPIAADAGWQYQSKKNEMTDQVVGGAFVVSKNRQNFHFPYEGGTSGKLVIIKKGEAITVRVEVDKGQFLCGTDCTLTMRLDDNPAATWKADRSSDGNSRMVYFDDDGVADKIAAAKRVRIQARFYQEGERMFDFDTRGLRWPLTFDK